MSNAKRMVKAKLEAARWYTLTELAALDAFPWCGGDVRRYKKTVLADREHDNVLKANVTGTGKATRYQLKGENIIRFIGVFESGKARL